MLSIRCADKRTKAELAGYYRSGIERVVKRAATNSYGVGVPFIWCSNNLIVAFITQVHLYELMTGDKRYHASMLAHRDWLLGRNPWGTSMFEGLPVGGEYPEDTHLPTVQIPENTGSRRARRWPDRRGDVQGLDRADADARRRFCCVSAA